MYGDCIAIISQTGKHLTRIPCRANAYNNYYYTRKSIRSLCTIILLGTAANIICARKDNIFTKFRLSRPASALSVIPSAYYFVGIMRAAV